MGKSMLIMVIGTAMIIGSLTLGLNNNSGRQLGSTVDYLKREQARLISDSGIEVYLEKLREDKSLKGTFLNNSWGGGTYDVYISGPDSALVIKSIGHYEGTNHTTVVNAKRDPITMPNVQSAMYISTNALNINLNGSIDINGNDFNMDGSAGSGSPKPGVGVDNASDSAYVVNNIKPKISKAIEGEGGTPSVHTVSDTTNWEELTQNLIFAADNTLPSGTYSSGNLGTASQPKITYVNGDATFTGNLTGYGIMVINGDLTLSGTFDFYGVIILYGPSTITTNIVGNCNVYGGTIIVGSTVNIKSTGNSQLYYSSQAIDNAKVNLKSSRFAITSWWE